MKYEEYLLEAAQGLLLLSSSLPPHRPQASKNRPLKAHHVPPPAAPVTDVENALSGIAPPLGFRSSWSRQMGKCKRKKHNVPSSSAAVAAPCSHRSPDTPLLLVADSDPSTSGSDGFFSSPDIPPLKRFHAGEAADPLSGATIKTSHLRSPAQAGQSKFLLPDLNEPAPESQEPDSDGE